MSKSTSTVAKPYAMSHLNIILDDNQGGHAVKCIRIKGHPMSQSGYARAVREISKTVSNGNKILAASMSLISEQLKEQCCRVFQPDVFKSI